MYNEINRVYSETEYDITEHLKDIFAYLCVGMLLTAGTAFVGYRSIAGQGALDYIISSALPLSIWLILLVIFEVGTALILRWKLMSLPLGMCKALYYIHAFVMGSVFSLIPLVYDTGTVFTAFLFAAVLFGCCAVIGYTTHLNLLQFRTYLFAGLITLFITTVVSLFVPVLRNSLIHSYIGVILFMCYTAYDIQVIKKRYEDLASAGDTKLLQNFAVYGAFQLYVDAINLFMDILNILNKSKNH